MQAMLWRVFLSSLLIAFAAPVNAWAQDAEEGIEATPSDDDAAEEQEANASKEVEVVASEDGEVENEEALPQIGEDRLAVFVLQRGFFLSADLGIFMTFGGVRGYSNVQPYVGIRGGFDINEILSVQLALASGYSSGNALSQNDAPSAGGQEVVDYSLLSFGGELVAAWRPNERIAIEPKLGGGMTRIHPQPTDPNNIDLAVPALNPHVVAGLDLKYLTLLTDFSAGVSSEFYYVIGPNIPAAAVAFVVRYTF